MLLSSIFTSCKKDDDNNDRSARTKENLSGSYVLVSAIAKSGTLELDITNNENFLPSCTKDDVITLNSDNSFVSTDAGVKCTPDGSYSGTWSLPNTNTIILDDETFTILDFDGTNLKLSYKADTPLGQADIISTFKKQ